MRGVVRIVTVIIWFSLIIFYWKQRFGGCPKVERDQTLREAAELAAASDVAIVVVGLSADWESEGFDRANLALPCNQDELIYTVLQANPRTVVVIQAVRSTILQHVST